MTISNDEWERRILCSDGNCIGVIGADGCCKVCGKPYEGDLPLTATSSETIVDDVDSEPSETDQITDQPNEPVDEAPADEDQPSEDDWDNRTLCIDESCIGVVGPDGRCKECGKHHPDYHKPTNQKTNQ
jgi:hypothetical protein